MGFFIPDTMKNYNNWVVWREKIPYNPKTGYRTDPTKPCCSYDEAITRYKYSEEYTGIGFVFTKECGLTFIDLDHCIDEDGNESPLAQEMQELFKDCYIEVSQSETGLHIVCIGSVPQTIKTKEIEIYSSRRFMAMTGNAIKPQEPQRAQERLDMIFNRYKPKTAEIKPQNATQGHTYGRVTDTQELINAILNSRQGKKWARIHAGNYDGYPSPSEAAQAYINIVNYFSGGNIDLIKGLFSQSQFPEHKKKYTEESYINRMIQNAQKTATGSTENKRKRTNIIEIFEEPKRGRRRVAR